MLPQFKFHMENKLQENTYYWGVMTESTGTIREERILFRPAEEDVRDEVTEFTTVAQRVVIGRKMQGDEDAPATPIYYLKMEAGSRIGSTEVRVRIRRNRAAEEMGVTIEEHLEIDAEGMVGDEGVDVRRGWRTLLDERYFLDTGGLDNIELDM